MNDSIYDEYMRNVLGYKQMNNDTYNYETYYDNMNLTNMYNMSEIENKKNQEIEEYYPEIYGIIYPMIQRAYEQNTKPITKENIDNITEEIYLAIENKEDRQKNENPMLKDIIRILLLREILGKPVGHGGPPPRPRQPRPPMRPPMGPPRQPSRKLYNF